MKIPVVDLKKYLDYKVLSEIDHHFTGPLPAQSSFGAGGSIHHEEGLVLRNFAVRFGGPVLEIGSDHGVSTRYIHEGLERHGGENDLVVAIDRLHKWEDDPNWPRRIRIVHDTWRLAPRPTLGFLPEKHRSWYRWAFIDACHSFEAVLRDTLLALLVGVSDIFYHDCNKEKQPRYTPEGDKGSDAYDAAVAAFEGVDKWNLFYLPTFNGMVHATKGSTWKS